MGDDERRHGDEGDRAATGRAEPAGDEQHRDEIAAVASDLRPEEVCGAGRERVRGPCPRLVSRIRHGAPHELLVELPLTRFRLGTARAPLS